MSTMPPQNRCLLARGLVFALNLHAHAAEPGLILRTAPPTPPHTPPRAPAAEKGFPSCNRKSTFEKEKNPEAED
jgi:hypothetical protein